MSTAVQLDAQKEPTGCRVPTIVPIGEFSPGQAYEVTDEQGEALLALPDGPFVRATLKAARAPGKEAAQEAAGEAHTAVQHSEPHHAHADAHGASRRESEAR